MKSRWCFVFVIFYFTAVLIFTICLRSAEHRVFYQLCTIKAEQGRLKQELREKQLQVEELINPAIVSEGVGEDNSEGPE